MLVPLSAFVLGAASLASALPAIERRTVTSLNQAAFQEAQQRDGTATRAFSSIEIKTSDGKCLFVDELSGDFRANLTPIQVVTCDNSAGQKWDIITSGKHDNVAGTALVVSALTQACLNFDDRRAAGNQVLLFSCGGRGDGSGGVQNAQLYAFNGGSGPLSLSPKSNAGTCITVKGNVLDQAACNTGDANQFFTFGDAAAAPAAQASSKAVATAAPAASSASAPAASPPVAAAALPPCQAPQAVVADQGLSSAAPASSSAAPVASSAAAAAKSDAAPAQAPAPTSAPAGQIPSTNPTTPVPVSRAGGTLNPSAAAEAMQRDNTATRALSSVSLKSADGQCLFIDPTAGDFRENLIPVNLKPCDGSPNEKFDVITAGKHNNVANSALIVSSLTQGCLNFDDRRAAGDTVILFSCGGRGDGEGAVTDSQLFAFKAGETSLRLAPNNGKGSVCLVPKNGRLDQAACSSDDSQLFTIS